MYNEGLLLKLWLKRILLLFVSLFCFAVIVIFNSGNVKHCNKNSLLKLVIILVIAMLIYRASI